MSPVVLVNPPCPQGRTINREGFGGLGVVTPGTRGFVYPSQRLAEAAGLLLSRGQAVVGLDFALDERRAQKAWKRVGEASAAIVHVSTRTLVHDLNVAQTFQRAVGDGPLIVTGVGLESHRDAVEEICPKATIDIAATGYVAARMVLETELDPGPPDSWPDACWDSLPLAKSRRLPIYHGRGCIHDCDYCPYVIATGREHFCRSAERTLSEISAQASRHRPKRIVFRDPAFGLASASTLQVLGGLATLPKKSRAPFEIETRPELLTDEMLDALAKAGCAEIKVGVESFEPDALVATRRVGDKVQAKRYVETVEHVLAAASERRLTVRPYVMNGLPAASAEAHKDAKKRVDRWGTAEIKRVVYPEEGASRILG